MLVTGPKEIPWPVENLDLLKLNLESILTENYEAAAKCCVGHLYCKILYVTTELLGAVLTSFI